MKKEWYEAKILNDKIWKPLRKNQKLKWKRNKKKKNKKERKEKKK